MDRDRGLSRATLSSIKSNTTRVCSSGAKWFTIPHAVVKTLLMLFSIILVTLMLMWESNGIRISDLTDGTNEINYRNPLYGCIGIALLTILYSISMMVLGCSGAEIPAIMQAIVTAALLLGWLILSAVISALLDVFDNTKYSRDRNLDTTFLRIANVFGFVVVAFLVADILLAFIALRANDEEKLARELKQSRSQPSLAVTAPPKHVTGRGSYRHRLSTKTSLASTRASTTRARDSSTVVINTKARESTSPAVMHTRISEDATASGRPGTVGGKAYRESTGTVGSVGRMSMPTIQSKTT